MKKIFALTMTLIISTFVLVGCGQDPKKDIIGKWSWFNGSNTMTYTFNEDGTGDRNGEEFKWTIDQKNEKTELKDDYGTTYLPYKYEDGEMKWNYTCQYKINHED